MKVPRIHQPKTVDHLSALLKAYPSIQLLGGGTLIIPNWRVQGVPKEAVYLPGVPALRQWGRDWCGAAATLTEVSVQPHFPHALRQAAASIASPMIRNIATIGGNLASDGPRCLAVALLVLNTTVERLATSPAGEKTEQMQLEEMVNDTAPILAVRWTIPAGARSAFNKIGMRLGGGPYYASVAVRWDGPDAPEQCAIAAGSTGVRPHRLPTAEEAWARYATDPAAAATAAGQAAAREVVVAEEPTGRVAYRRHLVGVLVQRTLLAL